MLLCSLVARLFCNHVLRKRIEDGIRVEQVVVCIFLSQRDYAVVLGFTVFDWWEECREKAGGFEDISIWALAE